MKRLFFSSVILLSLTFLLFSCKTAETLATTSQSGDDTVIVSLKDTAFVEIVDNPSTGYKWSYDDNTVSKIISYEGDFYYNPKPQLIGSAGTRTFKFFAKKAGVTTIKLQKQRGTQTPIETKTILIVVEK